MNAVRAQRPLVNEASGRSARTAFTFVKVDALHAQRPLLVQILPFARSVSASARGHNCTRGQIALVDLQFVTMRTGTDRAFRSTY